MRVADVSWIWSDRGMEQDLDAAAGGLPAIRRGWCAGPYVTYN